RQIGLRAVGVFAAHAEAHAFRRLQLSFGAVDGKSDQTRRRRFLRRRFDGRLERGLLGAGPELPDGKNRGERRRAGGAENNFSLALGAAARVAVAGGGVGEFRLSGFFRRDAERRAQIAEKQLRRLIFGRAVP